MNPDMHLLPTKGEEGETACYMLVDIRFLTPEINEVTCPHCLEIHEEYLKRFKLEG